MKILLVTNGLPDNDPGGVQYYTLFLAQELAKKHEVFIFTREWNTQQPEYRVREWFLGAIRVTSVIKNIGFPRDFVASYRDDRIDELFRQYLTKINPDIVHCQHQILLSANLVLIARERKIPVIVTLHDFWYICPSTRLLTPQLTICPCSWRDDYGVVCYHSHFGLQNVMASPFTKLPRFLKTFVPRTLKEFIKSLVSRTVPDKPPAPASAIDRQQSIERKKFMREMLRSASLVIVPSDFVKSYYVQFGLSGDKIKVIPHGIVAKTGVLQPKKFSSNIRFGYLGTFYRFKGIEILVRAFRKLNSSQINLKIYGNYTFDSRYYREVKRLAGRDRRIQFLGGYDNKDLPAILSETDVVVIPTLALESFNMVVREAFQSKTPVIASRIGAIPEVIADGKNGILFEPGNSDELAAKMQMIIDRPLLIKELQYGVAEVKDMEQHAAELENIYRDMIEHQ